MAPRRSVRCNNVTNHYNNLSLKDVLCPICRSILIEPVSLPCNHGFCLSCFENTVANTNLVCPLCRIRISSWLRISRKDNKLINVEYWNVIQKNFPEQVKNKLNGAEEYSEEVIPRLLSAPGEIGREFVEQQIKTNNQLLKEREVECKASEEYIKKLQQQEEYERIVCEENLRLSEQVAKKLAQEYCFDPGPSGSGIKKQGPIDKLLENLHQNVISVRPLKEYTCKNLVQKPLGESSKSFRTTLNKKIHKIGEGEVTDSNDSIDLECRYFKPIQQNCKPLSKKIPTLKVPALLHTVSTVIIGPPNGETKFKHSLRSAFVVTKVLPCTQQTERKDITCDTTTKVGEKTAICKRKRLKSPSVEQKKSRLSSPPRDNFMTKLNGVVSTFNLKKQEQDDYEFAKKLQQELNGTTRYSTRNYLKMHSKNLKKPPTKRQVTLKEILSQTVSKIPQ
ncbi:hypothetical protein FQA39_LY06780 [Lamprigera yunnana]|nr:hypothetical protein FQA39_LY06780 [Lamprigera yunnana]